MIEAGLGTGGKGVLNIKLLDGFFAANENKTALKISNQKACGLLCYLALSKTGTETRERLAGLLWSEHGESQARASLRQCLRQLRTVFGYAGFEGLTSDRNNVSLAGDRLQIDILEIHDKLHCGSIHTDLKTRSGSPERLLYGYEHLDQSFTAWLHVTRRNWHDQFVDQLQEVMKSQIASDAKDAAEAMLMLDPTHEEAHRHLIRHYAKTQNVSTALNQYKILWDLLGDEFDMEPDAITQALIAEVKSGIFEDVPTDSVITSPLAKPTSAQSSRLPVIEIHPFKLGGPCEVEDYFIQGFRQELIACLVRFRDWVVIEAQPQEADTIKSSTADYKVETTYLTSNGKVLITVTLADAHTWRYIWSDRYTLSLDKWAQTQQQIAQRVAAALDVYLSRDGINRQVPKRDLSLEAYDLWLQGQNLLLDWRSSKETEAENLFKQVIDVMPSFAPAYSSLANIYNTRHIVTAGYFRQRDLEEEALRLARRAVELDPLDNRANLALAWSYAMAERFDQAAFHYELSHNLNQSNPGNLISCAQGWAFCDRKKEAIRLAEQALILNPSPAKFYWGFLVGIHFICEDYEGALTASHQSGDVIMDLPGWTAAAYAHVGKTAEAQLEAEKFVSFISKRWQGPDACNSEKICEWFLHSFPIKSAKTRKKLEKGLRLAGLPV